MKIGVTGSSGFMGSHLCDFISGTEDTAVAVTRGSPLPECETLVHIAGLAHQRASRAALMKANFDFTLRLADEARRLSVRRLVFVSSINVVAGHKRQPLTSKMTYSPTTDYGESKAAAERALLGLSGIEVVILRPPLVYGPGAKGSLATLMRACATGAPLPFSLIENQRSMVGITNVCSAIHFLCMAHTRQKIFHVKDAEYSLSGLIAECREAMDMPPRMFGVPTTILRSCLHALKKSDLASQLLDDLVVEDTPLREVGWQPTYAGDMKEMGREAFF